PQSADRRSVVAGVRRLTQNINPRGVILMSKFNTLHQHALAAAVAVALTAGFSGTAAAAGRVDTAGLHSKDQTSFDQFIVKYRAGTAASDMDNALIKAAKASPSALSVGRLRALSVGGEVVKAN